MPQNLARNLRLLRIDAGLSQHQLALRAGLRQQDVSAFERGLWPSEPEHVAALARALGVTEAALLAPLSLPQTLELQAGLAGKGEVRK